MSYHPASPITPDRATGRFVRMLDWLVANPMRVIAGLAIVCGLLAVVDLLYEKHPSVPVEALPFFYPVFGFVIYALVIFGAKTLRLIIRRREDYYAPYSIDAETPNSHMTGEQR